MTEIFQEINQNFEDYAGNYGAAYALSTMQSDKRKEEGIRKNHHELKGIRATAEKTLAIAQQSHNLEERRLQIEQARLKIEECKRKEEQLENDQKKLLAERQKNARLSMTAINKEIDILENSITI